MIAPSLPNGRRPRRVVGAAAALLLVAAAVSACAPAPPPKTVYDAACDGSLVASTPGTVTEPALHEISGIAASRRNPGAWWVHNDSGNPATVYAIGDDGHVIGTFALTGKANVDWEDIAVGPGPATGTSSLYVADIGDFSIANGSTRPSIVVYRLPEPDASNPGPVSSGVDTLTFTYPGGAKYDAESFMVDPVTGKLYIVTKALTTSRVFEAPADLANGSTTVLTQVATVPVPGAFEAFTGADVSPDGSQVVLRTDALSDNGSVVVYPRPAGQPLFAAFAQTPCAGATGPESQGEAIGFTPDGRGYVTISEGSGQSLHELHAP